ncbi:orotidine-5'-phosphate decarboxylase [Candidatus Solincola tengchongensis]|uniref:orotidine-5'-phosphate decarboxylase n=1 Tax=Candidatus Solincola tengchongensis TaxID=2900693 RepID=UPI00257A4DD0|nr:orotidine-5'-phosphate decarboxylase [Candidatus Solincola tengchongensis]
MTAARRVGDPLILALDVSEWERLEALAEMVRGEVETVKVGLEAYTRFGPVLFREMRERGFRVFADLKLHDIPNTVSGAVRALARWRVDMLTVHLCGGRKMLEAAVRAAHENGGRAGGTPLLIGVTVLTSLEDGDLEEMGWRGGVSEIVLRLARMGVSCGLDGLVCSPAEVAELRRELGEGPLLVTPGIRLQGAETHDQARTATPGAALRAGADYLVVGRAVTGQPRPLEALRALRREIGLS